MEIKWLSSISDLTFYRGRVALYALLKSLDVGPGDHVVTQAFTCVAVPEAIMATGARPIYVDIDSAGFNMDPGDLELKITPLAKAVIVQHTYGIPSNLSKISQITERDGIPIIEDCCHTLKSRYRGNRVGSFGVGSFYSFEWGKPIVAGIGGSAVINAYELKSKVQSLYNSCLYPSFFKVLRIQLQYIGFKVLYRPRLFWLIRNLFRALGSIGIAEKNYNSVVENQMAEDFRLRMPKSLQNRLKRKLEKLEQLAKHSRWISETYQSEINSEMATHPDILPDCDVVFARYPLLAIDKEDLLNRARGFKVELADWYSTPVHPLAGDDLKLVHYKAGSCRNAEKRCSQVVTLPTHSAVGKREIDRAIRFLNNKLR